MTTLSFFTRMYGASKHGIRCVGMVLLVFPGLSLMGQQVLLHFPFNGNTNPSTNVLGGSFSIEPVNAGDPPIQNAYVGGMVESNPIYDSPTCGSSGGSALSYSNFHYGDALRFTFNTNAAYTAYKWSFCDYTTNSGANAFGTLITRASYDGGSTWWYFNGGWGVQTGSWTPTPSFSRAWQELPASFEHRDEVIFEIYKFDDPASSSYALIVDNFRIFGTPCTHPDRAALIELYEATDGDNWINKWDTTSCDVCGWYGIGCNALNRVISIDLEYNNLKNFVPLIDVPFLQTLNLSRNNELGGSFPNFSTLSLIDIDMDFCKVEGQIPSLSLPNLRTLSFRSNMLGGSIPNFNLPNLRVLNLGVNNLSGNLPNFNMPELEILDLDLNDLSGIIPNFNMHNLTYLDLSNNDLTGNIPDFYMPNLVFMVITSNGLTGSIPNFNMPNLRVLDLYYNNLSGNLPDFNLPSLEILQIQYNNLSGNLPDLVLPSISILDFRGNNFSGCFPASYYFFCNINFAAFSNNPLLPWQGDFSQFCMGSTQDGAPCDNNATAGADEIQPDCSCDLACAVFNAPLSTNATTICNGESADLTFNFTAGTGPYTVNWSGGSTLNNIDDGHLITVSPTATTTYTITSVTDNNGCPATGPFPSVVITVNNPPNTNIVTGNTNACQGSTTTYTTNPAAGATSYNWTVPVGAFIMSGQGTNSISVNWPAGSESGDVCVTAENGCLPTVERCRNVTFTPIPAAPALINGPTTVCRATSADFSVNFDNDADTYQWTLPPGATISSGANTENITVNFANNAQNGNICVRAVAANGCGPSAQTCLPLMLVSQPVTPVFVSPPSAMPCIGETQTYTVSPQTSVDTYSWDTNGAGDILSGDGTNTVTVQWTEAGPTGLTVIANSTLCDNNADITRNITVRPTPDAPADISGAEVVCGGQTVTYVATAVPGATGYTWNVSGINGFGQVVGPTNTNQLQINWLFDGVVTFSCRAINACGVGEPLEKTVVIQNIPVAPTAISGPAAVCVGSQATYSVGNVQNNWSFNWTVPANASIMSGQGTPSVTVQFNAPQSGTIGVTVNNNCSAPVNRQLAVTASSGSVLNAGPVNGPTGICPSSNASYTVSAVSGANGYQWTVPTGATIVSGQNTTGISVNWGTATGGQVCVSAVGTCGAGTASCTNVSPIPGLPVHLGNDTTLCPGTSLVLNAGTGAGAYAWSTTATTNSITVSATGMYSVTVSAGAGNTCTAADAIAVTFAAGNPPAAVTQLLVPATTVNVPVNTALSWNAPGGCLSGYTISIGTSPGGNQIAGPISTVGNSYQPGNNLPSGTTVYITLIPSNAAGNGPSATFSFTTAGNGGQNCATADSLALVAFYWATGGPNWTNKTNWLVPGMPIGTWFGITTNATGCVSKIELAGNGNNGNGNNLVGIIPSSLGSLSALMVLNLGYNDLYGPIPVEFGNLSNLVDLLLFLNNLTGGIPDALGRLNNLRTLSLSANQNLGGVLSDSLSKLIKLKLMDLSACGLTGTLPSSFGSLDSLGILDLSINQLSGPLPSSWSNLLRLRRLHLEYNKLDGPIPDWIGTFSELEQLVVNNNLFSGVLPPSMGALGKLKLLLVYENKLSGLVPSSIIDLINIEHLLLFNNQFNGTFPFISSNNLSAIRLDGNEFENLADYSSIITWDTINNSLLTGFRVSNNHLTFKDIVPNMTIGPAIFQYAPQDSVFHDTTLLRNTGENLVFSLDFDENVTGSVYKWYKDGVFQFDRTDNDLVINNLDPALHAGVWRVQVTNSAAPDLTLYSRAITVQVQGAACPPPDGINYWGTIICTMENSYIRHFGIECTDCTDILSMTSDVGTVVLDPINHTIVDITDAPYGLPVNITFSIYSTNTGETCGPYMHTFEAVSGPTESIISTGGTVICPGETTILSIPAVPSATYTWWRNGVMQPNSNTNQFTANQAGTYQVTWGLFPAICVSQSIPLTLSEGSAPFPVLSANTPCQNGTLTLQDNSGTGVAWSWSGPQGYSSNTNPATRDNMSFATSGTYSVTVTNAEGCTATATIDASTYTIPMTTSFTSPHCLGQIEIEITSMVGAVTYDWSDLPGTNDPEDRSFLPAGSYSLTVTDSGNGCTKTADITFSNLNDIIATADLSPTICNQSNGEIQLNVSGGQAPYSFFWADLSGPGQPQDRTGLPPGTYEVTVSESSSSDCWAILSLEIVEGGIGVEINSLDFGPAICGQNTGYINLATNQPPASLTIDWADLPGTSDPLDRSGLAAGTYTVTVTDVDGCSSSTSVVISQIGQPPLLSTTIQPAACGQNTGGVTLTVSGGTAPFNFTWSNTATTQNLTNVPAGTYTVTVQDGAGCTASTTAVVGSNGNVPVLSTSAQAAGCGQNTGGVTLTVNGGTAPFNFAWSNTSTTQNLTNVPAGTYTVTVQDGAGCTASTTAVVGSSGNVPVLSTSVQPAGCGQNTGGVTLTVNGGTAPFIYNWSNTSTTQNLTNVPAGTYTVTVLDGAGCTASTTAVVGSSGSVPVLSTSTQSAGCGQNTGGVTLTVNGGTAPFNFAWSNTATTQNLTNVPAGTYTVTVLDGNSCTASTTAVVGSSGNVPVLSTNVQAAGCGQNTGGVTLTVNGGTAPFNFAWSNTATTQNLTNVPAGTYTVTVLDGNGCTASTTAVVGSSGNVPTLLVEGTICTGIPFVYGGNVYTQVGFFNDTLPAPGGCDTIVTIHIVEKSPTAQIVAPQNTICPGISITLTASATNCIACAYTWSTTATTSSVAVNQPASYGLTVTDANGCSGTATFALNAATQPTAEILTPEGDTISCEMPVLLLKAQSTGNAYQWSGSLGTAATAEVSQPGQYQLTVTNAAGCTNTASVEIFIRFDPLQITRNDTTAVPPETLVTVNVLENDLEINPDTYDFSIVKTPLHCTVTILPDNQLRLAPLNDGYFGPDSLIYQRCDPDCPARCDEAVLYIDVLMGCVPVPSAPIPEALTPNGDGSNDVFDPLAVFIGSPCEVLPENCEFFVFNRAGECLFAPHPYAVWTGTQEDTILPNGAYPYILKIWTLGNVTVIKSHVFLAK